MTSNKQIKYQQDSFQIQNKSNQKFQPRILYTWFGKEVPEDYMISLAYQNFPLIFVKNPEIQRKFKRQILDIQKSDYYRLHYLYQYGGIYSDFDNNIDYECIVQILKPYKNQDKVLVMPDNLHNRQLNGDIMNNFIFAPRPKMPILKTILDKIDQTKGKIYDFAGIKFLGQFDELVEIDVKNCIKHYKDWSWFQDAGTAKNQTKQAHGKYSKKLLKKKQIIKENQILQQSYNQQKQQNDKLKKQLKESEQKLKDKDAQTQNKVQQFSTKFSGYQQKITQLSNSNANLLAKYSDLEKKSQNELNKDKLTVKQVTSEMKKYKQELNDKVISLNEKNEKINSMQAQNKKLKQDLKRESSQIQRLKNLLKTKQNSIKQKQQKSIQKLQEIQQRALNIINRIQTSELSVTNQQIEQKQHNIEIEFKILIFVVILILVYFIVKKIKSSNTSDLMRKHEKLSSEETNSIIQ